MVVQQNNCFALHFIAAAAVAVRDRGRRGVDPAGLPVGGAVAAGGARAAQHGGAGHQDGLRQGHAHAQEQARQTVSSAQLTAGLSDAEFVFAMGIVFLWAWASLVSDA